MLATLYTILAVIFKIHFCFLSFQFDDLQITPTMENPHVLEDIEEIVREEGIIERALK